MFGAQNPQTTGLFGSSQTGSTGFAFGTTTTTSAQPAFGTSSVSNPTGGVTFGVPNQPSAIGAFGSTPQPTTQSGSSLFGSSTSTPQSGFAFGTTTQAGLQFGSPAVSTPQTGLQFGTPTTSATQSGLQFGTPLAATSSTTGFSFGTTPATTAGLTLGATTTTSTAPGLNFGSSFPSSSTSKTLFGNLANTANVPATTTASLGLQSLSTPSSAANKPFGNLFAVPTTTTTTGATTGFNLSLPTTTQTTGFSVGGTSTGLFGLGSKGFPGTTASTATTTASIGLGGIDASQAGGLMGTAAKPENKAVKENLIPNEILQTIDGFKSFVRNQKSLSSDIARASDKSLDKVQEDIDNLKQMLSVITSGLQRNAGLADKLKADTAKCLHNTEMAQRTHDTPIGLQYDNVAPLQYFQSLITQFESQMQVIKQEIENSERHMNSLKQPLPLTSQELTLAMKRLHDSFVALAGRLQLVHNKVENQKEQYLNLRKYFYKDATDVFEEEAKKSILNTSKPNSLSKSGTGPTPFTAFSGQQRFGLQSGGSTLSIGAPIGLNSMLLQAQTSSTAFGSNILASNNLSSLPVENQSFQLQKPPVGNKRGKR